MSTLTLREMIITVRRKVREPRFCFNTLADVDVLDDGYKLRKYGQKVVKNTQHPRIHQRGQKGIMTSQKQGQTAFSMEIFNDSCPEGAVPVRRTTEEDLWRESSIQRFGRKLGRHVRRHSTRSDHEVSIWEQDHRNQRKAEDEKRLGISFMSET